MSLNKFMHPRNKYRKPPDFKALAIKYPEFRKYAKQDISGKVSLNFKDLNAVRALTQTLLLEDFSLDVEIPLDRLIPTLPLRLNYLLWIEDLLASNKITSDVKGIDIGCGASCVYPLLAAKQLGWRMLATEVDMDSAFIASRNVKKNNLQDMIKVRPVTEAQLLEGVVEPDTTYDFCMCNPPFFSSTDELDPKNVSRSPNRPAPRNAHSGTTTELVAPGGETAFVGAIIRESSRLGATVRVYSVMVGHKSSVGQVRGELQRAGVAAASVTTSEFCQGRTTRWGVAWTLDPTISFPQPTDVSQLKKKKAAPLCHTFQSDLTSTVDRLKILLEQLQITYKILKSHQDLCAMEITAAENTWSNSRKKRRQEKLKQKMAESNERNMGDTPGVKTKENGEIDIGGSGDGNMETSCELEKVTKESEASVDKAEERDQGKMTEGSGINMAEAENREQEKVAEESGANVGKAEKGDQGKVTEESDTNIAEAGQSDQGKVTEESGANVGKAEKGDQGKVTEESDTNIAEAGQSDQGKVTEESGANVGKAEKGDQGKVTEESDTNIAEAGQSDQGKVTEESGANVGKAEKGDQGKVTEESDTNIAEAGQSDQGKVNQKGVKRTFHEGVKVSGTSDSNHAKKSKLETTASGSNFGEKSQKDLILHGSLMVRKSGEGCSVELTWLKGSGGKDSAHQVLQYLKNNFEPH